MLWIRVRTDPENFVLVNPGSNFLGIQIVQFMQFYHKIILNYIISFFEKLRKAIKVMQQHFVSFLYLIWGRNLNCRIRIRNSRTDPQHWDIYFKMSQTWTWRICWRLLYPWRHCTWIRRSASEPGNPWTLETQNEKFFENRCTNLSNISNEKIKKIIFRKRWKKIFFSH